MEHQIHIELAASAGMDIGDVSQVSHDIDNYLSLATRILSRGSDWVGQEQARLQHATLLARRRGDTHGMLEILEAQRQRRDSCGEIKCLLCLCDAADAGKCMGCDLQIQISWKRSLARILIQLLAALASQCRAGAATQSRTQQQRLCEQLCGVRRQASATRCEIVCTAWNSEVVRHLSASKGIRLPASLVSIEHAGKAFPCSVASTQEARAMYLAPFAAQTLLSVDAPARADRRLQQWCINTRVRGACSRGSANATCSFQHSMCHGTILVRQQLLLGVSELVLLLRRLQEAHPQRLSPETTQRILPLVRRWLETLVESLRPQATVMFSQDAIHASPVPSIVAEGFKNLALNVWLRESPLGALVKAVWVLESIGCSDLISRSLHRYASCTSPIKECGHRLLLMQCSQTPADYVLNGLAFFDTFKRGSTQIHRVCLHRLFEWPASGHIAACVYSMLVVEAQPMPRPPVDSRFKKSQTVA